VAMKLFHCGASHTHDTNMAPQFTIPIWPWEILICF